MHHDLIITIASQRKMVLSHSREHLIGQIYGYTKFCSIFPEVKGYFVPPKSLMLTKLHLFDNNILNITHILKLCPVRDKLLMNS